MAFLPDIETATTRLIHPAGTYHFYQPKGPALVPKKPPKQHQLNCVFSPQIVGAPEGAEDSIEKVYMIWCPTDANSGRNRIRALAAACGVPFSNQGCETDDFAETSFTADLYVKNEGTPDAQNEMTNIRAYEGPKE